MTVTVHFLREANTNRSPTKMEREGKTVHSCRLQKIIEMTALENASSSSKKISLSLHEKKLEKVCTNL